MATNNYIFMISCSLVLFEVYLGTITHASEEVQKLLEKNRLLPKTKGTVKTIEVTEDGDMIDCVDIYKQPAFDNPLIADLKMAPSLSCMDLFNKSTSPQPNLIQNWHKYGECPEGTIPIRRTRNNDDTDRRKFPNNEDYMRHEYAMAYETGSIYHGGGAVFNVWNPQVRGPNEFSLSQIWFTSDQDHPPIETIEAGWIVYPRYCGDSQTRFFIYWTADDYNKTGCHNLECEGFVQTDRHTVLGGVIRPSSVYDGVTAVISINIVRDAKTNAWWLNLNGHLIGYFPGELFRSLRKGADGEVQFGGEIINRNTGNKHTATQMGSGHFPQEGYKKAAFVRNIIIVNDKYKVVDTSLDSFISRPDCYTLHFGPPETTWKSHFYFGGPGYYHHCV